MEEITQSETHHDFAKESSRKINVQIDKNGLPIELQQQLEKLSIQKLQNLANKNKAGKVQGISRPKVRDLSSDTETYQQPQFAAMKSPNSRLTAANNGKTLSQLLNSDVQKKKTLTNLIDHSES